MQPLDIRQFSPRAEITIYTKQGEVFSKEILNDAVNMNIVRGVDASAGMLTLSLVANTDKKGRSWLDRVTPMDYIEVRAGNKYLPNGRLPIRFRGFIDTAIENNAITSYGGPINRIQVTARDYVKLFLVSNIQYLWTNFIAGGTGIYPGLDQNFGIPINASISIKDLISQIVDYLLIGSNHSQAAFMPNFQDATSLKKIPGISLHCDIPSDIKGQSMSIQPYCGPIWSLINYLCSPPLGESFVYDAEDSPILVCRPVPFKDANGNFVSPAQASELSPIEIDSSLVTGYSVGKTDSQVQNFFLVSSDLSGNSGASLPSYASQSILDLGTNFNPFSGGEQATNPYWISNSVKTYGLKPLNVVTPWMAIPEAGDSSDDFAQQAARLSTFLGKIYGHNQNLRGGQIICHGDENLIHGRYANFLGTEFYIEEVQDNFSFVGDDNPTWTATLGVTRGQ